MKEIHAKVADILTGSQLAINAGSDQGVKKGNDAALYEVRDVKDPDTREVLGSVQIRRLSLRISSVQKKLSIATVSSFQDQPGSSASISIVATITNPPARHVITTDRSEAKPGKVIYVKPGDLITIRIPEPDKDDSVNES